MPTHDEMAKEIQAAVPVARPGPKLLERMREALRSRHYSPQTEQVYVMWIRRFIRFHNLRHPVEMGEIEINTFLSHLAVKQRVSASTQTQALSAILFLYRSVLGREIGALDNLIRARRPKRLPAVLTRDEVRAVLNQLKGDPWLMATWTSRQIKSPCAMGKARRTG